MDNCPHCKVSLVGDAIPEEIQHFYGDSKHWRREIGREYLGVYDGAWEWECPDCGGTWPSEAQIWRKNVRTI